MRPRLADAAFFWEQDRRHPSPRAARTRNRHLPGKARLPRGQDAAHRRARGSDVARAIDATRRPTRRAAELCKCDLLTSMVGEFPELQGIMGALLRARRWRSGGSGRRHPRALPAAGGRGCCLPRAPRHRARDRRQTRYSSRAYLPSASDPPATRTPSGYAARAIGVHAHPHRERRLELDLQRLIDLAVAGVRTDIDGRAIPGPPAKAHGAPTSSPPGFTIISWSGCARYYLERISAAPGRAASPRRCSTRCWRATGLAAGLRCAPEGAERVPRSARGEQPHGRQQAHRQHPAQGPRRATAAVDIELLREPAERRLMIHAGAEGCSSGGDRGAPVHGALGRLAQLRPAVDAFFDR